MFDHLSETLYRKKKTQEKIFSHVLWNYGKRCCLATKNNNFSFFVYKVECGNVLLLFEKNIFLTRQTCKTWRKWKKFPYAKYFEFTKNKQTIKIFFHSDTSYMCIILWFLLLTRWFFWAYTFKSFIQYWCFWYRTEYVLDWAKTKEEKT